jgi:hypothetical protein
MNVSVKTVEPWKHTKPQQQYTDDMADTIQIPPLTWQEPGYNGLHYAKVGLLAGVLAGCTSLVFNIIISMLWPTVTGDAQHPLRILQVYLTFPLGEAALQLSGGLTLALGCMLYLGTGALYGMLFVWAISYLLPRAGLSARLIVCSILALLVWATNFYALLAWLQPLLLGGRWIVELIPWWLGGLTHLVFGWTIALVYPLADATSAEPKATNKASA